MIAARAADSALSGHPTTASARTGGLPGRAGTAGSSFRPDGFSGRCFQPFRHAPCRAFCGINLPPVAIMASAPSIGAANKMSKAISNILNTTCHLI